MPDANGRIKGTGWSRAGEAAWERAFGGCCGDLESGRPCAGCPAVPHEPSDEVLHRCTQTCRYAPERCPDPREEWLADRSEAEEADNQAARDGYNPAW